MNLRGAIYPAPLLIFKTPEEKKLETVVDWNCL